MARSTAPDAVPLRSAGGGRGAGMLLSAAGWIWLMAVLAVASLLLSEAALAGGIRLSPSRALFHASSAATLTGFTGVPAVGDLRPYGQRLVVGLGYGSATLVLVLGAVVAKRLAGLRVGDGVVVAVAAGLPAVGMGLGAVLGGWEGAVAGLGAVSHSGLQVGVSEVAIPVVLGLLMPLAAVGGMGAVVVVDVWLRVVRRGHRLTDFTRWTLVGGAVVWLALSGAFWVGTTGGLTRAAAVSATAMGWGFPLEFAGAWPRVMQLMVMVACGLGLGVGGAAGGVGVVTGVVAVRGMWGLARGGRVEPDWVRVGGAGALVVAGFMVLMSVTLGLLLYTEPQLAFDRVLMLAVSSVSCAGVSPDPVGVVGPGLMVMSGAMLAGRVWGFVGLWWMWRCASGGGSIAGEVSSHPDE